MEPQADRISALPEPIIHLILSLLPTKSVKLATSLSKTWYAFCSSFPYLDFTHYSYNPKYSDHDIMKDNSDEDYLKTYSEPRTEKFFIHISETLRRFHERSPDILIRRIRIKVALINSRFELVLNDCIRLALEHGVEKIVLKFRGFRHNLPAALFVSNTVRELKINKGRFFDSFRHGGISVSCSKLRKLDIKSVYIGELALRSIILNCPLMEELLIEDAKGLKHLRISHLHKLKSLVVYNFNKGIKMVEVDAPMFHCLQFSNGLDKPPSKIRILECPRLAKLYLNNVEVENFQLEVILSRLPFLSSLWLTKLVSLTKFKISNDSLNMLVISKCTHLEELEVNAPNLLRFVFESNSAPLMSPMYTIMGQSQITLHVGREPFLFDNFVVNFRNFVSRLDRINCLCIYLRTFAVISADEHEERVVQPVANIKELEIIVHNSQSFHYIFNGLLRSCHPRILTMHLYFFEKVVVMKFLRDIMVGAGSCASWLPYLEEIMFRDDKCNVIRLPMDGTVHSSAVLERCSRGEIKFVFKW